MSARAQPAVVALGLVQAESEVGREPARAQWDELRGQRKPDGSPCPQDTFQDYQEMFVQFGYVVLFSSAFPLAALCALVNNLIEIRSDAFKLCTGLQRPFGQRVESIGQWQVGQSGRPRGDGSPWLDPALSLFVSSAEGHGGDGRAGHRGELLPHRPVRPAAAPLPLAEPRGGHRVCGGARGEAGGPGVGAGGKPGIPEPAASSSVPQHLALLVKYLIHAAIPDIPGWVAEEMAKLEYQRREAFKVQGWGLEGINSRLSP